MLLSRPSVRPLPLILALLVPLLALLAAPGPAAALETEARAAILVDAETGTVLFEKNAEELLPPA